MTKQTIAIIGAGLSGLTLANLLKEAADVTVFEKARGVSGRMSTRYADPYQFDHAAQFFTARSKAFKAFLTPHIASGLVQEWTPKVMTLEKGEKPYKRDWFEPHYVAAPKMNDLCKKLAEHLNVQLPVHIDSVTKIASGWLLEDKDGKDCGTYDWVISSAPCHQTELLLPDSFAHMDKVKTAKMSACFSLMLGFDKPLALGFEAARVKNSPVDWISVNDSKPAREHKTSLLITTHHDWSEAHKDDDKSEIQEQLINELSEILEMDLKAAEHKTIHRWLYAGVADAAGEDFLLDAESQLAACGDWCIEGRVEAAFLSGHPLGMQLLKLF